MLENVFVLVVCLFWSWMYFLEKDKLPFALYMYIALCPYNAIISSSYSIMDKVIEIMLIISFIKLLINKKMVLKVNKWFVLYIICVVISALMTILRENTINIFISTELRYFIGVLLVVILGINVIDTQEKINIIFKTFAVNAFFLSLGSYIENLSNAEVWYYLLNERKIFILTINHLGIYLAIGILSFGYLFLDRYRRCGIKKTDYIVALIYIITCGSICVLTKSSAVLMGTIFCIGLYFCYTIRFLSNIEILKILMMILVFALIVVSLFTASGGYSDSVILQKLVSLLGRGSGDESRLTIWGEALRQFNSNFIIGIGPNMFSAEYNGTTYISHNDYLKVIAETGTLGIITFVGFIFNVINNIILYNEKKERFMLLSVISVMLIFMLTHNYIMYSMFWIICIIPQVKKNIKQGEK